MISYGIGGGKPEVLFGGRGCSVPVHSHTYFATIIMIRFHVSVCRSVRNGRSVEAI